METFGRWVESRGLPVSLYVDRSSIYRPGREPTLAESLSAQAPTTQFGRAMEDLGVRLILANSPQAKGRVERRNGVFQDRLVKALRLAGANELSVANAFLADGFLGELNRRFTVEAVQSADLHRRSPRSAELWRALSIQEERVVQRDGTVSWHGRWYQLGRRGRTAMPRAGRRVRILEHLDGSVEALIGGRLLSSELIASPPPRRAKTPRGPTGLGRVGQKPSAAHPWRRGG